MANDFFQSKRNYNQICKWWTRKDEDEDTSDELIMKRIPNGVFYAKEVAPENVTSEAVGDSFMFERNQITIKSPDNLWGMKKNDLILYEDEKWIVESVQKPHSRTQNTFFAGDRNCSHYWYIEIRR